MDLELVIDSLDSIPAPLRECYTAKDGKYHLNTKGEAGKIKELRDTNIVLLKERDELKQSVETHVAKITELEKSNPRISALETELAAERAKTAEAQQKADRDRLRAALQARAAAAGVRPEALPYAADKLEESFVIEGDVVKAKAGLFSPDRPGEALTPDDALSVLSRDLSFIFKPSGGSGAPGGGSGTGGATSSARVLRNPTPQDLGRLASEITNGTVRVEYSE